MIQCMSRAQKGIYNTRGAKNQLLIDGALTRDCKVRHINLCTAWTTRVPMTQCHTHGYLNAWNFVTSTGHEEPSSRTQDCGEQL